MDPDMKATLVYTSGTTSKPKGVVLRHRNLLHQVYENAFDRSEDRVLDPQVGETFVSILPCWHIFERTAEYFCLCRGVKMVYSTVRSFKADLILHKPHFLIAVPRLFETIYKGVQSQFAAKPAPVRKLVAFFITLSLVATRANRVRTGLVVRDSRPSALERLVATALLVITWPFVRLADKLVWSKIRSGMGDRIKIIVSGGSSLPSHLEDFFEMAGQRVIVGYGLTETSPVICNRVANHNVRTTVGLPPPHTTIKIVHPETRETVPVGESGVICCRGPQVMTEYNRDPTATRAAIDKDGFFDTGDVGRINPATGDLMLTGRAKDTIVLSNGENIEPQPIEDAIAAESKLIDQVMLVGQDERYLGAVVAVNPLELGLQGLVPEADAQRYADLLGPSPLAQGVAGSREEMDKANKELAGNRAVKEAILTDMRRGLKAFRPWEQVQDVLVKLDPFSMTNGLLTQTLKIKRNVVAERYGADIARMY
ncbi:unnamed protein product, partial [Phaeothamnion confervicola]